MKAHKLLVFATVLTAAIASAGKASAEPVVARKSLTIDGAKRVVAAAVAAAKKPGQPRTAAIAVVDEGGNLMALERLDGTFAQGSTISTGKARTAALFKKPTKFFEELINQGRTAMTALPDFTPLQGGEPILVDGQIFGAVGVSGAASAAADEEIALAAANAITSADVAAVPASATERSARPTIYFEKDVVAEAFEKGAVLFDAPGSHFAIHASRRLEPGQAEVHEAETDVIHVLHGGATFVTGGSVIDPKTTTAGEIRGRSIEGGQTRQLQPGDVIVVPAGVPHQFTAIEGTFQYYVVKVR